MKKDFSYFLKQIIPFCWWYRKEFGVIMKQKSVFITWGCSMKQYQELEIEVAFLQELDVITFSVGEYDNTLEDDFFD